MIDPLVFPEDFIWGISSSFRMGEKTVYSGGCSPGAGNASAGSAVGNLTENSSEAACERSFSFKQDLKLLRDLGAESCRFFIPWSGIFHEGSDKHNETDMSLYKNLCICLLENGIKPWAVLSHMDLPGVLEQHGGWENRATVYAFEKYADTVFRELGDVVEMWTTVNNPLYPAFHGFSGNTGLQETEDYSKIFSMLHHILLAHGLAVEKFRKRDSSGQIGISINPGLPTGLPVSANSRKAPGLNAALYLDPLFGRGYPDGLPVEDNVFEYSVIKGDQGIISAETDFLGINSYNNDPCMAVSAPVKASAGRELHPEELAETLVWISENYSYPRIYITENGAAFEDVFQKDFEGYCDSDRISYLESGIEACGKALKEGVDLKGYFVLSLFDGFNPGREISEKSGLIHVNSKTNDRIPKESFYFYRKFIKKFRGEEEKYPELPDY